MTASVATPPPGLDPKAQTLWVKGQIAREKKNDDREAKQRNREAKQRDRRTTRGDRRKRWTARWKKARAGAAFVKANGPRIIPTAVYGTGVAVAITGQASVAHAPTSTDPHTVGGLGWEWPMAYGAGAFIEGLALSMALTEHALKMNGRSGRIPQALCWAFAAFAGAINVYAHKDSLWEAGLFAASSIATITLWQIRSNMAIAKHLEKIGHKAAPRPRLGIAYWLRFPVQAWYAWSATVSQPGIRTRQQAIVEGEHRRLARKARNAARKVLAVQEQAMQTAVDAARTAAKQIKAPKDLEAALVAAAKLAVTAAVTNAGVASPVRAIAATPAQVQPSGEDKAIDRARKVLANQAPATPRKTPQAVESKPAQKQAPAPARVDTSGIGDIDLGDPNTIAGQLRAAWFSALRRDGDNLTAAQLMEKVPAATKPRTEALLKEFRRTARSKGWLDESPLKVVNDKAS